MGLILRPLALALASGVLLALAFPPFSWSVFAYVAFVPLLLAAEDVASLEKLGRFRLGFFSGAVFWLFTICWLSKVTSFGWVGLALYCSLYTALWFWGVSYWWTVGTGDVFSPRLPSLPRRGRTAVRRWGGDEFPPTNVISPLSPFRLIILGTVSWVGLESCRATILTGFGWNQLAVSQAWNLPMIQIAAWGGAESVSALVIIVNMAVAIALRRLKCEGRPFWLPELLLALALLLGVYWFGARQIAAEQTAQKPVPTFRLALVQPNIPQLDKWSADFVRTIYRRLDLLTRAAMVTEGVDLVIWPETAVPDDVRQTPRTYYWVRDLVSSGVPLLVGSLDTRWEGNESRCYNSSFLFNTNGVILEYYDKQHLVLVGEYVPKFLLGLIASLSPIQDTLEWGERQPLFKLKTDHGTLPFAVLICFEDTLAELARAAVRSGAKLLVNETNDAWFDESWASRQHLAQAVLRCVENRTPLVRATNTGVTCAVDRYGRIHEELVDAAGRTLLSGWLLCEVAVDLDGAAGSFYTQYGPIWALVAACVVMLILIGQARDNDSSE